MKYIKLSLIFAFALSLFEIFACTTAIVSGKFTKDGRPILWKHRDTDCLQNFIKYFNDGNYDYVALVNADGTSNDMIWVGYNSKGFAIMNNASYNLKALDDSTEVKDQEGVLMKKALMYCASLEDFEVFLDTISKPIGVEANFGCIDANGGAAYYETNNFNYYKIDVNNPSVAPFGYIVKTNYSNYGRPDDGYGYIRYMAASELFYMAAAKHSITPEFIINDVSRSTVHGLTKRNLVDEIDEGAEKYVDFQDFIPRNSTSSSVVIQGVNKGEDPQMSTMWACVGWPFTAITIPVWLKAKNNIPRFLKETGFKYALACNHSLELKKLVFPIERGSGWKYLNVNILFRRDGTGLAQRVAKLDEIVFAETYEKLKKWRISNPTANDIKNYYLWLDNYIEKNYMTLTK